jgi:hypothetical protein
MIGLRTRILIGLLILLAAALEASAQTAQRGPPTKELALRKSGKFRNSGTSPATGTIPGAIARLCFQPGVGWQSILPEPPGVPARPGASGSIGLEVSRSTSVAHAPWAYARSSSEKQAKAECAGISINHKALAAGAEKFTILNRLGTTRSAGSTKASTVTSRDVTSPPPIPTYLGSEAVSDARSDQIGVRAFHAYISSIKLRRLIRNAPDFRTRIKLQQLQSIAATQLHKARVGTKTGASARRRRQGDRANRTSARRSDPHDRPRDNPRALLSGAYR